LRRILATVALFAVVVLTSASSCDSPVGGSGECKDLKQRLENGDCK
jgi:hypothetical protein